MSCGCSLIVDEVNFASWKSYMTLDDASENEFLRAVDRRLQDVLTPKKGILPQSAQILSDATRHLCLTTSAKRARPLLTLYFADALGIAPLDVVDAAAAAELIHSASLLHDDVIDEATTRRGRPAVNVQYSNSIAVLAGNYLLSEAFVLLNRYPSEVITDAVEVISDMTKAAIAELEIRGKCDTSLEVWREIAVGKTGALFAWCGQVPAWLSGNRDAVERVRRCGRHIGVIFQMADDVRDLVDTSGLKNRYADIKNREPSYPILLATQHTSVKQVLADAWLNEVLDDNTVKSIGQIILATSVASDTCSAMRKEIAAAADALGYLSETQGGSKIVMWLERLSLIAGQQ